MKFRKIFQALLIATVAFGCAAGGGDEEEQDTSNDTTAESTPDSDTPGPTTVLTGQNFSTQCGVVVDGIVNNPVYASQGERVQIASIVDSTFFIVRRAGGEQLVKLQGVQTDPARSALALTLLQELSSGGAYLFEPGIGCRAQTVQGGVGIQGHLLSLSGKSFAEELLRAGLVEVESVYSCSSEQIAPCYSSNRGEPPETSAGPVEDFLWKPQADSSFNPGKLVIHVSPCNIRVIVNGEELPDFGSGNGRCITARSQKTGCAYGRNVKVELIDRDSGLPYTHAGKNFVTVPNGCARFEFVG